MQADLVSYKQGSATVTDLPLSPSTAAKVKLSNGSYAIRASPRSHNF